MSYTEYRYVKYKQFTETDFELSSKICRVREEGPVRDPDSSEHTIHSATVSVQRAHKSLFELLRCNDWSFFLTLTFDNLSLYILDALKEGSLSYLDLFDNVSSRFIEKYFLTGEYFSFRLEFLRRNRYIKRDRKSGLYFLTEKGLHHSFYKYDDECVRHLFMKWRKQMRSDFPSMYYVAVPEYHQSGSIHYHVVVGGITGDQLGFVDSGRVLHFGKAWRREDFDRRGFKVDLNVGEGATIYNVSAWDFGFSTATEIRSSKAVSLYVSKYLTKSNLDPRFFNKKRFYASYNCRRPKVITDRLSVNDLYDPCPDYGSLCFHNPKIAYKKYDCAEEVIRARLRGELPVPQRLVPFDTEGKPVFIRITEE